MHFLGPCVYVRFPKQINSRGYGDLPSNSFRVKYRSPSQIGSVLLALPLHFCAAIAEWNPEDVATIGDANWGSIISRPSNGRRLHFSCIFGKASVHICCAYFLHFRFICRFGPLRCDQFHKSNLLISSKTRSSETSPAPRIAGREAPVRGIRGA